ncbi:MAG: CPBP family intramembrane metalloprotease [Firmicutes bacterium]|nr:CPBP family intramembrane metalloprotease [Bacillota bacterium]
MASLKMFLAIVGILFLGAFIAVGLDLNFDNMVVVHLFTIVVFIFILLAFIGISRGQGIPRNQIAKHYHIKRITLGGFFLSVAITIVAFLSFLFIAAFFLELFVLAGYSPPEVVAESAVDGFGMYILAVIAVAVMPGIVEELCFRGTIQREYERRFGVVISIIASSVLFSLIHMSPQQTVAQLFMGILWAVVYLRTRNMTYPILMHFLNNFIVVTIMYIMTFTDGGTPGYIGDPNNAGEVSLLTMGLMGFAFLILGTYVLIRLVKRLPAGEVQWNDVTAPAISTTETPVTDDNYLDDVVATIECRKSKSTPRERFFAMTNWGFFFCVAIAAAVWIFEFIGG